MKFVYLSKGDLQFKPNRLISKYWEQIRMTGANSVQLRSVHWLVESEALRRQQCDKRIDV